MPARVSEALVLRTYPLKEADLVVSFLTRDQGKLRGVAKRARRPKNSFGSGLERLSHVRMAYFQRETRELVNLDSCELIRSQFDLVSDYWPGVALDYFAELSEQLLPPAEANEKFFRLLLERIEPRIGRAFALGRHTQIALLERAHEPNLGLWSPCGGKLHTDTGESPYACACREAGEELGLALSPSDLHLTGLYFEPGGPVQRYASGVILKQWPSLKDFQESLKNLPSL